MSKSSEVSFVDFVRITVKSGDGGDGCVSFRHEKHTPRGGPDGGDGGKGGDVWLETDPKLITLIDLKYRPNVEADRGRHGRGKNMSGRAGGDRVIVVPVGTVVEDEEGFLADLNQPGQRFLAAAGGRGGLGNQHFATPTNQAPRKATPGTPGEQRRLTLELKLIADVGLIGLPNAGKSTLLKTLTSATPKVASYPFTTLHPNLGVMEIDRFRTVTLADIPGLIEGASKGVGLGDRFLRHIERTSLLAHLIAPDPSVLAEEEIDADTARLAAQMAVEAYHLVGEELRSYSESLGAKPQIVLLSKIDLLPEGAAEIMLSAMKEEGLDAIGVSALAEEGLDRLRAAMTERLEALGVLAEEDAEDAASLSEEKIQ